MPSLHTLFATLAGVLLVAAAVVDVRTRRIPNAVALAVAAAGLAVSASGGPRAMLSGIAASLVVFVPLTVLCQRAVFGGGDVKLMSAAAAGVGLDALPWFLAVVAMAGGVVAVVMWLVIRISRGTGGAIVAPSRRATMPYAVAIAAGGIWCLAGL